MTDPQIVSRPVQANCPPRSMAETVEDVAARHGLRPIDIRGARRAAFIAHARQEAMAMMNAAGFTTTQIGRFLNRDRTTVSYGRRAHEARIADRKPRNINMPYGAKGETT